MKLSSKTRYGIRSLIDLGKSEEGIPISIKEIATRQLISERYLENIFHQLRKAGLLESVKGKNGGFYLARPLDAISVLDILEALEGGIQTTDCVTQSACNHVDECGAQGLWVNLDTKIREALSSISLDEV